MARRLLSAAVGVVVGLALVSAPAAATSGPVTKMRVVLDALEVPSGTSVTGDVHVWTGTSGSWTPIVGASLSVWVDGVRVGSAATDADGVAEVSHPMTVEGGHTIKVRFASDGVHRSAQRAKGFLVTAALSAPPSPAPGVPDAPVLTGEAPAPGMAYLEWTIPADNGSPITGYRVYRGTSSGTETFLFSKGHEAYSADDVSVSAGTTYYYVVTAVNANGESAWSNEVAVTPF